MTALLTKYHTAVLFDGNPLPDVEVSVYTAFTTDLVDLFSDNEGVTPLANPLLSGTPYGTIDFYVGPGRYTLHFEKPSYSFPDIVDLTIGVVGIEEQTSTQTLEATAGAAYLLASAIRPAGSRLLKVTSVVTQAFGTSGGLTGFTIGDVVQADRWGVSTALTLGAATDYAQMRDDALVITATDADLQVFPVGGDFDNAGTLELTYHYVV